MGVFYLGEVYGFVFVEFLFYYVLLFVVVGWKVFGDLDLWVGFWYFCVCWCFGVFFCIGVVFVWVLWVKYYVWGFGFGFVYGVGCGVCLYLKGIWWVLFRGGVVIFWFVGICGWC